MMYSRPIPFRQRRGFDRTVLNEEKNTAQKSQLSDRCYISPGQAVVAVVASKNPQQQRILFIEKYNPNVQEKCLVEKYSFKSVSDGKFTKSLMNNEEVKRTIERLRTDRYSTVSIKTVCPKKVEEFQRNELDRMNQSNYDEDLKEYKESLPTVGRVRNIDALLQSAFGIDVKSKPSNSNGTSSVQSRVDIDEDGLTSGSRFNCRIM